MREVSCRANVLPVRAGPPYTTTSMILVRPLARREAAGLDLAAGIVAGGHAGAGHGALPQASHRIRYRPAVHHQARMV